MITLNLYRLNKDINKGPTEKKNSQENGLAGSLVSQKYNDSARSDRKSKIQIKLAVNRNNCISNKYPE